MVNYDKPTGTAGTMRISDDGATVQFWILCSSPSTTTGAFTWSGVVNGAAVGGTVSLPAGFGSRLLGSWPVSTTQTVTFHINGTGTQGLGGPTDHAAAINRTPPVVPPAPVMRPPSQITTTTMVLQFDSTGLGGGAFLGWDLQWATDAGFTQNLHQEISTGTTTATGLTPGTRYWSRARGVNTVGPGPWAAAVDATTLASVYVSDGTTWKPGQLYVDDGVTAKPAQLYVSDGSSWKPSG